jgi:hypothetical protein
MYCIAGNRYFKIIYLMRQQFVVTHRIRQTGNFLMTRQLGLWARWRSRYSDWLRVGRSGDRIPAGARFYAPVQTGPGAHPASCTMGTGCFPGVKSGRGVPWSRKGRAIPLLPLWAVRPVQSLSACTRGHFTYFTRKQVAYAEKTLKCNELHKF